MRKLMQLSLLGAAGSMGLASTAAAQTMGAFEPYVAGSASLVLPSDSDNDGAFTSEFETGAGVGLTLPSGTDVGWTTEFENGYAISGAFGARSGNLRGEVELAFQSNDVDTHRNVSAGGIDLTDIDAGVLITGSDPLGATVGEIVSDGRGSVDTTFLMANAYYDFGMADAAFRPYVGGGLGFAAVDVDYSPSGVGIISDDDTVFAYQIMGGVSAPVGENTEIFGGYRYRATEDVETSVSLFPADLDIENEAHLFEVGVRFYF